MAVVRLERVVKRFGEVVAVNDVSIRVEDREFLVLVGPSGCGKTTTLRMIAGLDEVTSGRVYIGERDVTQAPPKDRDIAMVFQSYALYPHMSVFDNMAFALRLRGVPRSEIEQRVKSAAEMLVIGDILNRKPRQLSGGQRQRVAVGRAIVRNPQVFLMDEPLSNLDAKLRVQTRAELIKLHRRLDATVVYVTHDQVEAMTMGTRIAVMKNGVVQQIDSPQNVYHRPANTFVAQFIGSPAMNLLDARVLGSHEAAWVEGPAMRLDLTADQRGQWRSKIGHSVIVGIRPEDISLGTAPDGFTMIGNGSVEVAELLGNEAILFVKLGGTDLVVRQSEERHIDAGQPLPVFVNSRRMHIFDPATQQSVGNEQACSFGQEESRGVYGSRQ